MRQRGWLQLHRCARVDVNAALSFSGFCSEPPWRKAAINTVLYSCSAYCIRFGCARCRHHSFNCHTVPISLSFRTAVPRHPLPLVSLPSAGPWRCSHRRSQQRDRLRRAHGAVHSAASQRGGGCRGAGRFGLQQRRRPRDCAGGAGGLPPGKRGDGAGCMRRGCGAGGLRSRSIWRGFLAAGDVVCAAKGLVARSQ